MAKPSLKPLILAVAVVIFTVFNVPKVNAETINLNPPAEPIKAGQPVLTFKRSVNVPRVSIPGSFVLTDTVKNTGTASAKNVIIKETLPAGWTVEGENVLKIELGLIEPGKTKTAYTTITVSSDSFPGRYANEAIVTADEAGSIQANAPIDLTLPQVLGATTSLAETGSNNFIFYGLGLGIFGILMIGKPAHKSGQGHN